MLGVVGEAACHCLATVWLLPVDPLHLAPLLFVTYLSSVCSAGTAVPSPARGGCAVGSDGLGLSFSELLRSSPCTCCSGQCWKGGTGHRKAVLGAVEYLS